MQATRLADPHFLQSINLFFGEKYKFCGYLQQLRPRFYAKYIPKYYFLECPYILFFPMVR
jgi:hypothetical protein